MYKENQWIDLESIAKSKAFYLYNFSAWINIHNKIFPLGKKSQVFQRVNVKLIFKINPLRTDFFRQEKKILFQGLIFFFKILKFSKVNTQAL